MSKVKFAGRTCVIEKLLNPPPILIQQIDAPVHAVILRGRWPQAGKYWTPGACLVRVTGGHIGWSGIIIN